MRDGHLSRPFSRQSGNLPVRRNRLSTSSFDPLYLFLLVAMASPGPNIILLTTYGARFGFRASVTPLLGIVIGVGIIGAATGLGIGSLLNSVPELTLVAKIASASWILWMALSLFNAERKQGQPRRVRPMTFVEAVLFQWVNPKIWAIALAAAAGFTKGLPPFDEAARFGVAFSCVNLFVCTSWTAAGSLLGQFLRSEQTWRWFMAIMAFLLAASAAMVFM